MKGTGIDGLPTKWERVRQNHWFDALYNTYAAGHGCNVRLVQALRRFRALA